MRMPRPPGNPATAPTVPLQQVADDLRFEGCALGFTPLSHGRSRLRSAHPGLDLQFVNALRQGLDAFLQLLVLVVLGHFSQNTVAAVYDRRQYNNLRDRRR